MSINSSTQHTFALAPQADIPRSSFRRNSNYKTTLNAGYLVPIFLDEVLPGDTFNLQLTSFARILSPLKYPILDNLYMDFQFFFCPTRLVYDDYEKFFGSSKGPEGKWEYDDSHLIPTIDFGVVDEPIQEMSIADYFGLPIATYPTGVSALPFRAYNRIISDWYRPSSYPFEPLVLKTDSTNDPITSYSLQKRMKRADYFTAALTEPQRGPGVELPLGAFAPVVGDGNGMRITNGSNTYNMTATEYGNYNNLSLSAVGDVKPLGDNVNNVNNNTSMQGKVLNVATVNSGLVADLSQATAVTISSMRQAFQLQRALERDERGGVRYVSQILSHFGVRSPDARLQRTEYLGGGSTPIQIHSVANTSGSDSRDQASLAAFGVAAQSKVGFLKSFTEHGYVIGLVSVRADLTYQQGIPRMFSRRARFDYYYPVFAHLGEQAILNRELYYSGDDVADNDIFGYQERFAEYRYGVSKITGMLNSNSSLSLDSWHLAQKFENAPALNEEFLLENVPMERVKAVTDQPDFLYDSLISLNCVRPMPLYGIPGLVDHF